jgi:D-alanyl-D-alanine carboxypeptidase/D-alanyl-D-alanine-endopeptidase (penicillin-binding protein 4)
MYIRNLHGFTYLIFFVSIFTSCSLQKKIDRTAKAEFINNSHLANAHIGISIFDPLSDRYIYDYQSEKYFIPASNTKIFTCYAGLKYLGDSLPGIKYLEDDTAIYLFPTGDPSLLHKDFRQHRVLDFLRRITKSVYITGRFWSTDALGNGWAWNDYNEPYMAERSPLPVYGNVLRWIQERTAEENQDSMAFDQSLSIYSLPEVNWKVRFTTELTKRSFFVQRAKYENVFEITEGTEKNKEQEVPFVTNGLQASLELLKDTISKEIISAENLTINPVPADLLLKTIHSQALDSILRPMMQRSDNLFAEQILLMAANERSGFMNEDSIINHLLQTDLGGLPHKPRWVDGSGLSRYNLFTPRSFTVILNKMSQEYTIERLKHIFPTPGTGTLLTYTKADSSFIFAKTGTLSGVVALSGFLYTTRNRLLIFSILVNNHRTTSTEVRERIEKFLSFVRQHY